MNTIQSSLALAAEREELTLRRQAALASANGNATAIIEAANRAQAAAEWLTSYTGGLPYTGPRQAVPVTPAVGSTSTPSITSQRKRGRPFGSKNRPPIIVDTVDQKAPRVKATSKSSGPDSDTGQLRTALGATLVKGKTAAPFNTIIENASGKFGRVFTIGERQKIIGMLGAMIAKGVLVEDKRESMRLGGTKAYRLS